MTLVKSNDIKFTINDSDTQMVKLAGVVVIIVGVVAIAVTTKTSHRKQQQRWRLDAGKSSSDYFPLITAEADKNFKGISYFTSGRPSSSEKTHRLVQAYHKRS